MRSGHEHMLDPWFRRPQWAGMLGSWVLRRRRWSRRRTTRIGQHGQMPLRVEPELHFINWQQDPFANYLARLVFPEKTTEFCVTVDLVAQMAVYNPFDFFLEPAAEQFPFAYEPNLRHDLLPIHDRVSHQVQLVCPSQHQAQCVRHLPNIDQEPTPSLGHLCRHQVLEHLCRDQETGSILKRSDA